MGTNCLLTPNSGVDRVAPCLVSLRTNSASPAQRPVRARARKSISYQYMGSHNNGAITRRKFVKGATGTALCCACLPLAVFPDAAAAQKHNDEAGKDANMTGAGKVHLAAACGTYCGACPAYIAKHGEDEQVKMNLQKRSSSAPAKVMKGIPPSNWMDGLLCDGCLSGGVLVAHCKSCNIRLHALDTQDGARCTNCKELPCQRVTNLINMGQYLHRHEYLPNLKRIREMGAQEWVKKEEARWSCPKCRLPMSWYDAECARCGEPRSKALFPLS